MPTELLSLAKIFNNRVFRIPDYQRGYAWGERQLADFWSDLQRVGTERNHYCGQITVEKANQAAWQHWGDDRWLVEEADYEPLFVVDGQQRLATAVILLQCLLQDLPPASLLAGQAVSELRERYLAKSKGLLRSPLFGYARDNPSHEFFGTQILGIPSNAYDGIQTVYTANLAFARDYFARLLPSPKHPQERERLFKAIVQRFRFNLHELQDDLDVFVAFETMNNRGKPLSRLELLKNRLIYLSTLANGSDPERAQVRSNINAVWRTVYEELGRKPGEPLDDDEFLRAHWIVFFGYDKDEADPLTQFLLNRHFTTERLDSGELALNDIQKYADSLQVSARVWQRLHFPEDNTSALGQTVADALVRLKRLGFGVLRPLLLVTLSQRASDCDTPSVLSQAERFLLLVRSFARTRSHVAEADSYRLAHEITEGTKRLRDATWMLEDRVRRHFSTAAFQTLIDELFAEEDDGKGYYDLPALKYVLFEYEERLRSAAKATASKISWDDFRGARNSVEHIYPQNPDTGEWPAFDKYDRDERRLLRHSLGNLVAVSVAKNASLSRRSFAEKKKGTATVPGFSQGSFSELRVAECSDWTAAEIRDRGLEMLSFIEDRWQVALGDVMAKKALLKLGFVN